MPVYRVKIEGETFHVEVPNPRERPVRAIVDGEIIEVHVDAEVETATTGGRHSNAEVRAPRMAPRPATPVVSAAAGEIKSPLPGTVVSISVAAGQHVELGQELCIIEAMKMNNPIRATKAGTVTQVLVSVGQQVQHGVPLFAIEGG